MKKAILYEIVNTANGKRYVGVTTTTIKKRWNVHLYRLRHGNAPKKIQDDFFAYGETVFVINAIDSGTLSDMLLIEKRISKETVKHGYNTIIGGGDNEERRSAVLFFNEKLKNNPEYARQFFERRAYANKGRKASDETRLKLSLSRKGKKWGDNRKRDRSKQYSGSGNPNHGNYAIYINYNTGIYYETPDLLNYLGVSYPKLIKLIAKKNSVVANFVKV